MGLLMSDMFAYAVIVVIPLLFLSGFSYYTMLFILKGKLKKNYSGSWAIYRDKAKPFESELMTAYKIIMDDKRDEKINLPGSENKLAKIARYNLYFSMALFMLVLTVGLYVSVNK
jgi:hypothetical protein